jgi:hypothetical protein
MQHFRLIAFAGAIALLTTLAPVYAASAASSATKFEMEEWRKATTNSAPQKPGCYTLQYPSRQWMQVDCGKQPPNAPRTLGPKESRAIQPHVAPLVSDWMMTPTNSITSATGQLITLNNVTSVGSIKQEDGTLAAGKFSLQLNSNMTLPASSGSPSCGSAPNAGCRGWIQFVYNSDRQLFIQVWFINYLKAKTDSCPSGMFQSLQSCGENTAFANLPATFENDFTKLQGLTLSGRAAGTSVAAFLTIGGRSTSVVGSDKVGAASSSWSQAEFNVFGLGGYTDATYSEVEFNPEAQITIGLTSDNDLSGKEPGCAIGKTTNEYSNLFLGPCVTTTTPGIWFNESPTAPKILTVAPLSGGFSGGTNVDVRGGPFSPQVQVRFGDQTVSATTSFGNEFTVGSPPGSAGSSVTLAAANIFPNGTPGPFGADSSDQFTYVRVPQCSFSEYCPFDEGQPPTYTVTCDALTDFYNYSGLPADPSFPTGLTPVASNTETNTGLMSAEERGLAACNAGTKSNCFMHSLETPQADWCINRGPPPPPPRCPQCPDKKCCADPNGGTRPLCLPFTSTCPHVR